MIGEVTYDLVMEDDMAFVEGCYRLPNKDWEVFIISKCDLDKVEVKHTRWESGVTGVYISVPSGVRIDAERAEMILSKIFDVEKWVVVRGPDSIVLR